MKNSIKNKKILILIEDGSLLYDNRVKKEAVSLTKAGYQVRVICPRYPGEEKEYIYKGIHVYTYTKWKFAGHLGEYTASLLKGFYLSLKMYKNHGFHCIQACNPPDILFLIAAFFKAFLGVKFVFDHHDVCPELYLSRYNRTKRSLGYIAMLILEKMTFLLSDGVITTNESYKKVAMTRGGVPEKNIRVVRNAPDLKKFCKVAPDPNIKTNGNIVIGYIGNMNPQDGVDYLLGAAKHIIQDRNQTHFNFVFIGKGDSFKDLVKKKTEWDLDNNVEFTGRIPDEDMIRYLSSCDICVQPDPKNPLNDISTMNKAMEYMALEKPVVSYDLVETRYTCGDCSLYVDTNSIEGLAEKILFLANNEELRKNMGKEGRKRVEKMLNWKYSEQNLIKLYDQVLHH